MGAVAPSVVAPSARPPPVGSLSLLAGFQFRNDAGTVNLPRSCERLVALLALHDRPLLRGYVAGILWADHPEERAWASLRSALWRLRLSTRTLVGTSATHLRLHPSVTVDAREASTAARRLVDPRFPLMESDLEYERFAADLLPDWYEDWVIQERERFRQLRLHALECLCDRLVAEGRYAMAIQAGLTAVAGEPLRESAYRSLLRAYLAEGNRSEAIRLYQAFRRLLADELGLRPSPEMDEMAEGVVRTASPDRPLGAPPASARQARRTA